MLKCDKLTNFIVTMIGVHLTQKGIDVFVYNLPQEIHAKCNILVICEISHFGFMYIQQKSKFQNNK